MSEATTTVETNPSPVSNPGPGLLITKTPSVISFGVGLLLFFVPFLNIKCNNMVLQKVSGVQLATGFKVKGPGSENSLVGSLESMNYNNNGAKAKTERRSPNMLALAALGLGIAGLALAWRESKKGSFIVAILGAVALVATMIDVKSKLKSELMGSQQAGLDGFGRGNFGNDMLVTIDFAPGLYFTILAFAAAAFFSYKWIRGK